MIKLNELDLLYASSTARKDYVCPAAMLVHIEPEGCLAAGTTRMGGGHEMPTTMIMSGKKRRTITNSRFHHLLVNIYQ